MLSQHHLPQLIPNRVNASVNRLQGSIWTDVQVLKVEASETRAEQFPLREGMKLRLKPVENNSFWGKLFDQRWCRVVFPKPADKNTWLNWKDQGEATLYIKGQAYFGFNVAHRHCRIPVGTKEIWLQSSCIQSAIWHLEANGMDAGGSYFEGAFLCRRNDDAWEAYHDLKCLLDLALDQRNRENPQVPTTLGAFGLQPLVDKFSPSYRRMLRLMDDAVNVLELKGVPAFRKSMVAAYGELRSEKTFIHCVLSGHAHLDLVWIWPERMGELKAVNIFATADRLMDEYPEFRFAYSQPASYEAVKRREPGLYQKVLNRIRSKKWQATGAMYVESDTIFACGEALARSFMLGQKGFTSINGKPSRLTWLPDVFGYSACLPQIMKQTGVEYFFTTKMTWNAINRFPHSSFIWRGNDGSEVVSHVTQESGYVTHMTVDNVKAPMNAYQQADIHAEYLLPTGYGDGGGGATSDMIERARRLDSLPGMPSMSWDHPEAFFERLAKLRDRLPVHQGECYLEYHRGTFTTHGNLKAAFRGLERALQVAEAASVVTGKRWDMEHAWKRLVFAQFHDYIPGSSVWDVYLEGLPELDAEAEAQLELAGRALSNGKPVASLFNSHAHPVKKWVKNPATGKKVYVSLPALSGTPVDTAVVEQPEAVEVKGSFVSNGSTSFRLNAAGYVESLKLDGEAIPLKASGGLCQLVSYPDRAANFDAWDIDRHVLSMGEVAKDKPVIAPIREGKHRAGFSVTRQVGKKSSATVSYILEAGSPLLHITVDLDWQEPEHLLKMLFPTRYAGVNARFGIPYGSVLRPQVSSGMLAEAMWEVPFSRHLEVFDEGEREGLFLVTEAKYGACVRDGEIGLSLVRSPRVTGLDGHGHAWPKHLTRLKIPSEFSDIGKHHICLALGRYDIELPRERQPAAVAETLFTAPVPYQGKALPSALQSMDGGETLLPAWSMPLDGTSWVLRCNEVSGRRGTTKIKAAAGWKVVASDIQGKALGKAAPAVTVGFTPYQLLSFRFIKQK